MIEPMGRRNKIRQTLPGKLFNIDGMTKAEIHTVAYKIGKGKINRVKFQFGLMHSFLQDRHYNPVLQADLVKTDQECLPALWEKVKIRETLNSTHMKQRLPESLCI